VFLTKIDLAPERRLARKYLGAPQALPRAVTGDAKGGGGEDVHLVGEARVERVG